MFVAVGSNAVFVELIERFNADAAVSVSHTVTGTGGTGLNLFTTTSAGCET